jgi:hypothetical protein
MKIVAFLHNTSKLFLPVARTKHPVIMVRGLNVPTEVRVIELKLHMRDAI